MRLLDLFSGIGGFSLAAQWVWGDELEIISFVEIDKYCHQILRKHWPNVKIIKDVRETDGNEFKEIDCITFGFPCQDLSVAGKRGGIHKERSGLFFEAMRIIGITKPKIFVFENVKGLLSSNGGEDFRTVRRTIADIGLYECEWQLLNTRWFLPQNRERVYFVGHIRGRSRQKVFPITEGIQISSERNDTNRSRRIKSGESFNSLRGCGEMKTPMIYLGGVMGEKNKMWLEDGKKNSRNFPQGQRVCSSEGCSAQLNAQAGGWGAKTGLYAISPCIRSEHHNTQNVNFIKSGFCDDRVCGDISPSLMSCSNTKGKHQAGISHKNPIVHGIRRLTPLECERLQGFPDGWTEGLSDTQRYKALGNAVSVPIPKVIFRAIKMIEEVGS